MRLVQASAWPLLPLTVLVSGCCCRSCDKPESHVNVPTTLDELKKKNHPPEVVVRVERREDSPGNFRCGSAVCLVVLPVVAYAYVFPPKWDEATVTENGTVTYLGRFETDGSFISATVQEGGQLRFIHTLKLKVLGKTVIVENGRAPLGADGKPGKTEPSLILPQVDLIADYDKALAKEKDAKDRAALLYEAWAVLQSEAQPWTLAHLADTKEQDLTRAEVGAALCGKPVERGLLKGPVARVPEGARGMSVCEPALRAVAKDPGPRTSAMGLEAAHASLPSIPHLAEPFASGLVKALCQADFGMMDHPDDLLGQIAQYGKDSCPHSPPAAGHSPAWHPKTHAAAVAALASCSNPVRRTTIAAAIGEKASAVELEQAFASKDKLASWLWKVADGKDPATRSAIVSILRSDPMRSELIQVLHKAGITPTEDELVVLAAAFLQWESTIVPQPSAQILALLRRATQAKVNATKAKDVLTQALGKLPKPPANESPSAKRDREATEARLQIALVVLGDRSQAVGASRGLVRTDLSNASPDRVRTPGDVIAYGLLLAGCDESAVKAAAERASSVPSGSSGSMCTKP